MANEIVVKNTLAFLFPGNAAQPTLADMGRFVKTLKGDRSMMDTAYKISDKKSVFIRFKSEDAMKFSLENNNTSLPFHYTDGKKLMVRMSVAGGNTRYVRVFDLPPEATDLDLSSVLGKFGKVNRVVRERFPAEIGLDMFSGVRGLYMDIEREIPEALFFHGWKGRVYYDGMKPKCYVCKSDAHLKKSCPIVKAQKGVEARQQQPAEQHELELLMKETEERTDEAASPAATGGAILKQHNKPKTAKNRKQETKRQLSTDSETNRQPQEKRKANIQPTSENESDGSMITVPDGSQVETEDSDSDSAMEDLDLENEHLIPPEVLKAWDLKMERKRRRQERRVAKILGPRQE